MKAFLLLMCVAISPACGVASAKATKTPAAQTQDRPDRRAGEVEAFKADAASMFAKLEDDVIYDALVASGIDEDTLAFLQDDLKIVLGGGDGDDDDDDDCECPDDDTPEDPFPEDPENQDLPVRMPL